MAILLGLEGDRPESVVTASITTRCDQIKSHQILTLDGTRPIPFIYDKHVRLLPCPAPIGFFSLGKGTVGIVLIKFAS